MRKKTLDELIEKANIIHNSKYTYENFCLINTHTPSYITCPIHGDFLQSFDAHIHQKSGCPECAKEIRNKKNSKFYREMLNINDKKYSFNYCYDKFEYNGYDKKSLVICPIHGEFLTSWHKLKYGHGCPKCGNTKNYSELRIFEMLKNTFKSIEYQKRFEWLGRQSIDFYLPEYNVGIEYQGRQHFYNNTKFDFKDTIERDRRKRNKCIENDVKLYYFTFEKQYIKNFNEYIIYTDYNEMINDITNNRKPTLS